MFSKALAGTGVTSNGIMPGLIYTPLVEDWFKTLARQQGSYDPAVGRDFAIKNVLRQTVVQCLRLMLERQRQFPERVREIAIVGKPASQIVVNLGS